MFWELNSWFYLLSIINYIFEFEQYTSLESRPPQYDPVPYYNYQNHFSKRYEVEEEKEKAPWGRGDGYNIASIVSNYEIL